MVVKIFTGSSNPQLASRIAAYLNTRIGDSKLKKFTDGELWFKYNENIRGCDVFLVQSTLPPAENLMELLIMLDAAKRSSAKRITAVIPYFGYARQDRKDQPRVAITAKLVADLLATAGADRVLTMDLHAAQIQGFFNVPFDHLYASAIFMDFYRTKNIPDLAVVAPDIGAMKLARAYSNYLDAPLAVVDKRRPTPNVSEVMNVIGDVKDRNVLMVDDLVDTGGSLTQAAKAIRKLGAKDIYACCTHAILSGNAVDKIEKSPICEFVATDTVPEKPEMKNSKIKILTASKLIGESIRRIFNEESISSLFVNQR
ncbi:ribose-phosphate pyrophosphokinase [candidate division LCP-89 bacterium B3_LCP]|uniref:Ribose-phosphate pyrophosphokinase n=1 Tax=candidate division LCP-89 bacterium B3_LCP TaxID=2012998 RepID=A0A532UZK1_UNCL8|nr:MAG: ribose-phosphate pyrophosphokinase [candidate division LCP-89 bacterium B3_LCP]